MRLSLAFPDPALERTFRDEQLDRALPVQRLAAVIGVVATVLFAALDLWLLDGEGLVVVLVLRGVLTGLLLVLLAISYYSWHRRVADALSAATCAVLALAFQLEVYLLPLPTEYAALATAQFIVYACTMARVTFRSALAATAVALAGFVVFGIAEGLPGDRFTMYLAFAGNFCCAALVGAFFLERAARAEALARHELEAARGHLEALARQLRGTGGAVAVADDLLSTTRHAVDPSTAQLWLQR